MTEPPAGLIALTVRDTPEGAPHLAYADRAELARALGLETINPEALELFQGLAAKWAAGLAPINDELLRLANRIMTQPPQEGLDSGLRDP